MSPWVRRLLEAGQLLGLAGLLVGLYLLAGLAWALLLGGVLLAAGCVLAEISRQNKGST